MDQFQKEWDFEKDLQNLYLARNRRYITGFRSGDFKNVFKEAHDNLENFNSNFVMKKDTETRTLNDAQNETRAANATMDFLLSDFGTNDEWNVTTAVVISEVNAEQVLGSNIPQFLELHFTEHCLFKKAISS